MKKILITVCFLIVAIIFNVSIFNDVGVGKYRGTYRDASIVATFDHGHFTMIMEDDANKSIYYGVYYENEDTVYITYFEHGYNDYTRYTTMKVVDNSKLIWGDDKVELTSSWAGVLQALFWIGYVVGAGILLHFITLKIDEKRNRKDAKVIDKKIL